MDNDLSKLTDAKTFYGYPIEWFEECSYLNADGYIKDGKIHLDGVSGGVPIRMKEGYRHQAEWD